MEPSPAGPVEHLTHCFIPVQKLGTKTESGSQAGEGPCDEGERDRDTNSDLELRRFKGTLAGKEWFVPISWNDRGCDRGRDRKPGTE